MKLDLVIFIFLISSGIQCVFLLLLATAFARYKKTTAIDIGPVSVIIAARNELKNLPRLLNQLIEQDHPNFEIVIVNDRSTDGTYDYLMEKQKLISNLRVVNVEHKPENLDGKKYALTLGIKAAKNDSLVFTDGDCEINNKSWLQTFALSKSDVPADINLGVSLYKKSNGLLGAFIQFESYWTFIQYIGFALLGMPYMGVGRNLAYRKSLFLNSKGFNAIMNITGGDDDLFVNKHASKKNTIVTLGKQALTLTEPKKNWSEFFIQKLRHISVGRHYKLTHRLVLGILSLSHFLFYVSLVLSLLANVNLIMISVAFLLRTLFLYLAFIIANRKIAGSFPFWSLLFLDFIYVFYYLSVGLKALFTKRVRWI